MYFYRPTYIIYNYVHTCTYMYIYIYICMIMMGYIEYRIDSFGLKKHLPESVKKPIHRVKASSEIEKALIHRIWRLSIFDPGKIIFSQVFDRSMDCHSRLWLIEPKKCPICWVSHMFSIWRHRYSYGICFGSVCALQNSTPNILSYFFCPHPKGWKSAYSM